MTGVQTCALPIFAAIANSVSGSNVSGQVGNSLVSGTVYSSSQPNITSVGTLTSLSVTGNISSGNLNATGMANVANLYMNSGYIETPASAPINLVAGGTGGVRVWSKFVPNANVGQNIGSTSEYWSNIYVANIFTNKIGRAHV